MADELNQADRDAMLIVEAFALGQRDPAVWDAFIQGWTADVYRRLNAKFGTSLEPSPPGDPGTGDGGDGPGAEPAAPNSG